MKYYVTWTVSYTATSEVDADSLKEAREIALNVGPGDAELENPSDYELLQIDGEDGSVMYCE